MSLLLAFTFNDNSSVSFADFSGNKQTGSGTISSMVAGQNYGYAANFGATNNYITVTPANFSGITAVTVFMSVYLNSLPAGGSVAYLVSQSGSLQAYINSLGKVVFKTWNTIAGNYASFTTATTLSTTTWYTIGCVADGSNMYAYINGALDTNSGANTSLAINNNAVYIGNDSSVDTSNTFSGYMDCIEFRSSALSAAYITQLNNYPGGILITNTAHNFATGDMITDSSCTSQAVVTWVTDSTDFYIYPLTTIPESYTRIGNIFQTVRQYYMQTLLDFDNNGNGQINIIYPIAGFSDFSSPANTISFDYRGITGATNLIANMRAITSLRI